MKRALASALVATLAACATAPEAPPPAVEAPAAQQEAVEARSESQPLKHLVGRKLEPIPARPLNISRLCRFHDESGTRGKLDLRVKDAEVKRFLAEVFIPRQGTCRFEMKGFAQTGTQPVRLAAAGSDCAEIGRASCRERV